MEETGSSSVPKTASPSVEQPLARPKWFGLRKQFSLATLLLVVFWVAGGINVWLYRQAWVVAGEFKDEEAWFSKDSSKCMLISGSESLVIDAHTGVFIAQAPFKPGWYACLSANWERAARFMNETNKPPRIEIYDGRSGALEQTLECNASWHESRFSEDSELFFASASWICAYRRNQNEPAWCIDILEQTDAPGNGSRPSAQGSAGEERILREAERAVCEAKSLSDLEASVEKLGQIPHPNTRMGVRLSPYTDVAVTLLVTASGTRAFCWNLASGKRNAELESINECDASRLDFSFTEDGSCLGALDLAHGKAIVWDLVTGRLRTSLKVSDAALADGNMALCSGGRISATLTGSNIRRAFIQGGNNIRLWECSSGRLIKELPSIQFLAFSPDGERLVGVDGPQLVIFDTESGAQLCTLPAPSGECWISAKYAADGRSMAVAAGGPFLGGETNFYCRQHPEGALGLLALPGSWSLLAASLLLAWRILRRQPRPPF